MTSAKTYPHTEKYEQIPANDMIVVAEQQTDSTYNSHTTPTTAQVPVAQVSKPKYVQIGSRKPVVLNYCPNCAVEHVGTNTRTKATGTTWVFVGVGVLVCWPLCWLPLVIKPMKQTNHYCVSCKKKIGRVKPFQ